MWLQPVLTALCPGLWMAGIVIGTVAALCSQALISGPLAYSEAWLNLPRLRVVFPEERGSKYPDTSAVFRLYRICVKSAVPTWNGYGCITLCMLHSALCILYSRCGSIWIYLYWHFLHRVQLLLPIEKFRTAYVACW